MPSATLALLLAATPVDAESIRAALGEPPATGWTMHAVRVGVTRGAKRATFIADPRLGDRLNIAFSFWVLRGHDRILLIDTGFVDRTYTKTWRIEGYRDPAAGLAALDIEPSQVTDVIVTHDHWDHIGGLVLFPRATAWLHKRTLAAARKSGRPALDRWLLRAEASGRLRVTSSLELTVPGVLVVHAGLHTAGFQYVVVHNPEGIWVFASDIAPLRANFERGRPTGLTRDPRRTLEVMGTMRALVDGNLERIVTGHDPNGFDEHGLRHLSP
jgi:glyoxylase-like metal-dependent hydrolase (beta-lactamase superfamily II)